LHQPLGLTSPATTLHDFGGTKSVQVAHIRMSFGLSWYCASFCDIFSCVSDIEAVASVKRTAAQAHPIRITPRREIRENSIAAAVFAIFMGIYNNSMPAAKLKQQLPPASMPAV
jgi:hypothetical protein